MGQVVVEHIGQLQPLLETLLRQLHHKETTVERLRFQAPELLLALAAAGLLLLEEMEVEPPVLQVAEGME